MNRRILIKLSLIILVAFNVPKAISASFSQYVDQAGNISFPKNFQSEMVHLGSWFVPTGGASGFHGVYTDKEVVNYYKKHKSFPDGAVLVKELRASEAGNFTTGQGVHHSTTELKQWFVMVKDKKARFPNNPIWGDGWGWALFKPDDITMNLTKNYKSDCLACHIPATQDDFIYIQAYQILQ